MAQDNPLKLAAVARVDLNADTNVAAINNGAIRIASGTIDRQTWLDTNQWPLTYTVQVPILRFAWSQFELDFTPAHSGTILLSLRGPWEEVTTGSGIIYKQEVLWDALEAEGTAIPNGSFETVTGGVMAGWSGGVSQIATAAVPAVQGTHMARSWHNNSMNCTLTVRSQVPVVLRFWARAVVPDGFQDMTPFTSHDTPAHRAALHFARGVNFGNDLELLPASPGQFTYTQADFAQAKAEGFDHVRLPIAWQNYAGGPPGYLLTADIFAQVDQLVGYALNQGLSVMIDVHNFDAFTQNPPAFTNELYALWHQIAAHFSNSPPTLAFEVLNEPRDQATTAVMNPIFAEAVRQIRLTNPQRTIFLGPGAFNGIDELNYLILPDTDQNLIATVHTYDPFPFTHQGLAFAGADVATTPIVFPGPPAAPVTPAAGMSLYATNWINDYNTLPTDQNPSSPIAFRGKFQMLRQWSDYYGRPVHVGEFGANAAIEPVSRVNYYRAKRQALDEFGLGWAIWDWKAGFHYFSNGAPDPPGLRDALFPGPQLQAQTGGGLQLTAALGKTCVLERAATLNPHVSWEGILTQTLSSPNLQFQDSSTNHSPAAFYRALWAK